MSMRPLVSMVAVVGSLLAVSCGDDGDAIAAATIDVVGVDYGYENLPAEIGAGSDIVFANESTTEVHEFVALRLDDDDTRSAAEILALPPDQLGPMMGQVTSVIIAPPAGDAGAIAGLVVEGSATLSEPGRYVIFCAIPTGANPEDYLAAAAEAEGGPPDVPGGPPHFVEGMSAELVVR